MRTNNASAIALALSLALVPDTIAGQAAAGFDMAALDFPPGFLDLRDMVLSTNSDGTVVATGTTVLGSANANVLVSFTAAERAMTFAIKPQAWSITDAIPQLSNPVLDGLTFSNVGLVLAAGERDEESAVLSDAEWEFYSEVYKTDEFRLVLKPGINLIAAIGSDELGSDHPLVSVMNALGIEEGTILLQGTLGRSLALIGAPGGGGMDIIRDLYLRAELPEMRPPGSPEWFQSGQVALELTGDPSVRLVGEINIIMDGEELQFFLAGSLARTGMTLAGGLLVEGGWQQPFGIDWLILNHVILSLGITPTGSIQPGFAASLVIGEKDMDVAVSLAISPAGVPTSMMISGSSEAGFGLSDLVQLQTQMAAARDAALTAAGGTSGPSPAIPLDALPAIDFRSVALKFAPKDAPELNVERGMNIQGELWLPLSPGGDLTNFAGVDVGVSEDGLWARGHLGAFEIGPLVWDDAELDLTATKELQHLLVRGDVTLFGARQAVDLALTREEFSFRTRTQLFEMFSADIQARSVFDLTRPDFQVDAVMQADFGDAIGPVVQQGIIAFADGGADVLAAARTISRAAEDALVIPEATVEELRRALTATRQVAIEGVEAAAQTAGVRRSAMNAAYRARSSALAAYNRTAWYPAWRKAQARAVYTSANATYIRRAGAYNASMARLAAAQRILAAIPPVNDNVQLMRAEQAVAELRRQLREVQSSLAEMEARYAAINAAIARGEQVLVIDRAEFHGGLQSAMNGEAMRWDILGSFAGEPFEVHEMMDFSNMGEGAAQLLQALLGR